MKTAVGSGVVSSFFTIDDYWANGQSSTSNWREIDFEALGNLTNAIQTNIITAYETHHEEIINTPFYPYESFHVYAFEWTPVSIKFFIDDELVRQDYNDYVSTHNTGQKIMMNIWQPIWENWVGAFDETILPVYAYYDWVKYYSYTPGEGTYGSFNNFSFVWEDDFDFFNNQIWQKATHSWSANNAQFVQQNAVLQDGYLILCLTDSLSYGYSGGELSVLESNLSSFFCGIHSERSQRPLFKSRYLILFTSSISIKCLPIIPDRPVTAILECFIYLNQINLFLIKISA